MIPLCKNQKKKNELKFRKLTIVELIWGGSVFQFCNLKNYSANILYTCINFIIKKNISKSKLQ